MVMQVRAGTRLAGRYRLERQLGKGGMGTVWQAHDQVLDRPVAVKFVNARGDGHPEAESRLQREARALGSLAHPHLAHVHDLCETQEGTFIVMELIHGESLATRLASQPRLPPARAAGIAAQCAQALGAAHHAGIVHRDVKPSNIMLTGDNVKLIDFGIAGSLNPTDTPVVGLIGTVAYLAPERLTGSPATPATDLYALGVVLYEMLAGRRPFQAEESVAMLYAHATADPRPLPASVPTALADICLSLLAKDPAARPESLAVARELQVSAAPEGSFASSPRPRSEPSPHRAALDDHSPPPDLDGDDRRQPWGILLPAGGLLVAAIAGCTALLITTTGTPGAAVQPDQARSAAAPTLEATAISSARATPAASPSGIKAPGPTYVPTALETLAAPTPSFSVSPTPSFSVSPTSHPGNPHPGKPTPKPKPTHR
ncbi:MAG TPA: protein kinase [Actinocrinis sp.]|nr:protein kinase [Actinocrinis sp.]